MIVLLMLLMLVFSSPAWSATYYVDQDSVGGACNNSNAGTLITAPWCTIGKANTTLAAGDTVYIRQGTYSLTGNIIVPTNTGAAGNVITYSAYSSDGGATFETVTIQGAADATGYNSRGILLDGKAYVKVTRLIFTNLAKYFYIDNGGNHNEISYCTFQTMRDVWGVDIVDSGTAKNDESHNFQSPTVLYDNTKDWSSGLPVTFGVHNTTDGSSSYNQNSNTPTTITSTSYPLVGGTNNYWSNGDTYTINYTISWAGSYILHSSTHNWIHHNTFKTFGAYSNADEGVPLEVGSTLVTDESNYNTIENNHLYSGGHHALGINSCKYCVIRNNYVHNESWYGGGACASKTNGKCGYRVISSSVDDSAVGGHSLWEGNRVAHGAAYGGPHLGIGGSGSGTSLATPSNIYRFNEHIHNALYGLRLATTVSGAGWNNRVYNNTFFKNGYGADDDPYVAGPTTINDDYRTGIHLTGGTAATCANVSGNVIKNNILYDHWSTTNKTASKTKYYPSIYAVNATLRDSCDPLNVISNNYSDNSTTFLEDTSALTEASDPLFTDDSLPAEDADYATVVIPFTTAYPNTSPDLTLQAASPAIDGATYLTQANGAGTGSTTLIVDDASYFQDGTWGSSLATLAADWIAIGTVSNVHQISSINYATNTITLATPTSWSDDASIWLYKKSDGTQVLYGAGPDYGAHEYAGASDVTAPTITAFTIPATAQDKTISVTFTATDDTAVTSYCIVEVNNSAGCSWSGSAPTTYTCSRAGVRNLYAFAKDAANNVSSSATDSITITLPTMSGGSGSGVSIQ